jgi:hypothetical protein
MHTCSQDWFGTLIVRVADARSLHTAIVERYETWLSRAPEAYTEDGFFMHSVPIAITSRCGQNQQICRATEGPLYEKDLSSWTCLRDFAEVRYMSIAIASQAS